MVYSVRIFLCFTLLMISVNAFGAYEERTMHETYVLNERGTVDLENVNGNVTIRGWDKNEVDLKATKRGPSKNLDLVEIRIESTPERLSIETKYPRRRNDTDVSVRYELMVPRGATLNSISNVNGEIDILGVEGSIKISTVNGSAEIEGSKSSVDAETVNGNISAKWNQFPQGGDIQLETVNGSLELELPANADADLAASSLNGSIHTDFPVTVQGTFFSRKISGKIGQGGSVIDLSTVNGSIDIVKAKP